jgi:hypothetical protein
MIKIEQTEVYGWEAAIRGMRNPMNSWDKSDTKIRNIIDLETDDCIGFDYRIGENDHDLMMNLAKAGRSHSKYRRMVNVTCDINAPLYWWKEYDTYKVGTVANSCSTMHKIQAKEFTLDDFSHEHLCELSIGNLQDTINVLNKCRNLFLETKDKKYWWQMIQLLPTSYNQLRTVQLNYEVLANMYHDRNNHKLDEWREFCKWIESLPCSEIITGEKE